MGYVIEILLLVIGVVIVSVIFFLARPMSEAMAEKMRLKSRGVGSDSEKFLKDKVSYLESEVLTLKDQIKSMQESLDYVTREVEGGQGETLKSRQKQH